MKVKLFTAAWCPNCRVTKPWVLALVPNTEIVDVGEIDGAGEAIKYDVMSLPTIVVTKDDGELIDRLVDGVSKNALESFFCFTKVI